MTINKKSKIIIFFIGVATLVYLLYAFGDTVFGGKTYVRIIDKSSDQAAPYPGADINAVEIRNHKTNASSYGQRIVSANIQDGNSPAANQFRNPDSALADPQTDQNPRYVSLGGGQIIIEIDNRFRRDDRLLIYEIGADKGPTAEQYSVATSRSPDGPWEDRGTFAGLADITN